MTLHKSFHATDPDAVYDEGKLPKIEFKINCRIFILISSPYQPNLIYWQCPHFYYHLSINLIKPYLLNGHLNELCTQVISQRSTMNSQFAGFDLIFLTICFFFIQQLVMQYKAHYFEGIVDPYIEFFL